MKLTLKKKKAAKQEEAPVEVRQAEGWLKDKDHDPDYTERFKNRLYVPPVDGATYFYEDLTVNPSPHVQECSRHIRPLRICVRKDFLVFSVPFEGKDNPVVEKDFAPLFKIVKDLEKKYGLKFVGCVHGDESAPTLKNPPPVEEEPEEEEVPVKKFSLKLRKKK